MAHMQAAGDVGRRHGDAIGLLVAFDIGGEHPGFFPEVVMLFLDIFAFEGFFLVVMFANIFVSHAELVEARSS